MKNLIQNFEEIELHQRPAPDELKFTHLNIVLNRIAWQNNEETNIKLFSLKFCPKK
jgi:hypothetical protein